MRKSVKIIVIVVVAIVIGYLIYQSPDEAGWLEQNPQDAIKTGHIFAFYLLNSYKPGLLKMTIDPAKAKINGSSFREISTEDMAESLAKKQINIEITAPLFGEQRDDGMELVMLERQESFIVMTFAFKTWDNLVEIPDKGKMLFSVGVRYYKPPDNRLLPKLIRKIANLPLVRNVTGRVGTTGRWVVFDYNYRFNRNDYFEWVLIEGESYSQKQVRESEEKGRFESEESFEKYRKEIDDKINRSLDSLYKWGCTAVKTQNAHIESLWELR